MAAFPGPQSGHPDVWAGLKRARADMTGYAPSPTDAVYLVSPFMMDESMTMSNNGPSASSTPSMSGEELDYRGDAKSIMNDYVLLSSTGHCMFECMSRGIAQKIWVMSNNQRGAYFENLAQAVRSCQGEPDIYSLLQSFLKGGTSLTNMAQLLIDAYTLISKNVEAVTQSSPQFGFNKSPWTMYTTGRMDTQRQSSIALDDRKWVTPNSFTPSLSVEQSMDMNTLQVHPEAPDDGGKLTMDKTNARKKTVSALNRMKQFVVPSNSSTGDTSSAAGSVAGSVHSESPHVSPSMPSMSSLPNFPFNVRPNFPMGSIYSKPCLVACIVVYICY